MSNKLCSRGAKCIHYNGPLLPLTDFQVNLKYELNVKPACKACEALDALRHKIKLSGLTARVYFQNKLDAIDQYNAGAVERSRTRQAKAKVCKLRYAIKHAELVTKRAYDWYHANKERASKKNKEIYIRNSSRIKQRMRVYYQTHIEQRRQKGREYARTHRRQNLDRVYRWLELHPDKMRTGYIRRKWATSVYMRYNWQCIICESDQELNAHHCVNFTRLPAHLKWDTRVGVCLCSKCHRKFHSKYGKTNTTRKELSDFIVTELLTGLQREAQVLVA